MRASTWTFFTRITTDSNIDANTMLMPIPVLINTNSNIDTCTNTNFNNIVILIPI